MPDTVAETVPRGLRVAQAWLDQIRAQTERDPTPEDVERIRRWCFDPGPCNDCGAQHGEAHADGCDVARCLWTGGQRLQCAGGHDCGQDVWDGCWPGVAEAVEFGWYSWFEPGKPWHRCGPNHPQAGPDLNRINVLFCRWDRERRRWARLPWDQPIR